MAFKTTTQEYRIMGNKEELDEVRKHKRLHTQHGTVAALEECKSCVKVGLVTDISKSELAFCYFDHGKAEEPKKSFKSVISWNASDFFMDNIPCKVISDQDITRSFSVCIPPMRLCRVRFGELMPDQASKLEHFIENFTKDSNSESDNSTTD
jgi:hypothetical protein